MKKILLMILLLVTAAMAESQCEKDIKRLLPIARKWTYFTTDFSTFFKTEITVAQDQNPFVLNYKIFYIAQPPVLVFEDDIMLPVKVKKKRDFVPPLIAGLGGLAGGLIAGIIMAKRL